MDEKNLKKLEYFKILERLAEKACSEAAKERALALRPSVDEYEIERTQSETAEAFRYLVGKSVPPIGGLPDVRAALGRSKLGGELSTRSLLDIARVIGTIRKMKDYGKWPNKESDELLAQFPTLYPYFSALNPADFIESEIHRCILAEDEIADNASSKLSSLRREIHTQQEKVRVQLQGMLRSSTYKTMLQDPVVTMRNGRYCLPVKSEYKGSVAGMVHDQSGSGSTLFIEPMAVIEINNRITELYAAEEEEIHRILQELTEMVGSRAEELEADYEILVQLDFVFAKGKLAVDMNAMKPDFSKGDKNRPAQKLVYLPKAVHPLLDPKTAVPITLSLGGDYTTLVITGPNTGGKTVSLKTLGLLCLMGQSGLHIPTASNPKLCIFDQVFADIGDEQSIEQSLSTFSSHMVNIVDIMDRVTPDSLCLFDELGAGTDPTEGAALAQAILEKLRVMQVLTAATTHYSELKMYALATERVENACCEFDLETLRPTYRLLIGVPGKSNAFAISKRLGLSEDIIHDAGELLESNDIEFEDMMSDLELRRREAEEERVKIGELRRQMTELEQETKQLRDKTEAQKEKILSSAREEARNILRSAKAEADHTIAKMNKIIQNGGAVDVRALEEERSKIRDRVNQLDIDNSALNTRTEVAKAIKPEQLKLGERIRIKGFDQIFSIVTAPDARGKFTVQAGIMKMQTAVSEVLELVKDEAPTKKKGPQPAAEKGSSAGSFGKSMTVSAEKDLRGMMTDEAIDALDKYLDDVFLAGLKQVSIIHGKGTGALRNAVHQFLKKAPQVKSYRLGAYGEGDAGVTVVYLKE